MTRPRLAHLIAIPKRYTPSFDTDISKTMREERKRIAEQSHVRVLCPRNPADRVIIERLEARK